jgi:hypothetical protein
MPKLTPDIALGISANLVLIQHYLLTLSKETSSAYRSSSLASIQATQSAKQIGSLHLQIKNRLEKDRMNRRNG